MLIRPSIIYTISLMYTPAEIKKKDRFLIIFYVIYFSWLLLTTYFSQNNFYNNLLVAVATLVYFIFFNETFDLFVFALATVGSYIIIGNTKGYSQIILDIEYLKSIPFWTYASWGFTAIALKKLFSIISRRVDI